MTFQLIETKTLTTSQTGIDFTSIPQDATDLFILTSVRCDQTNPTIRMSFNSVGTGQSFRRIRGTGSTVESGNGGELYPVYANPSGSTSNTFSNDSIYIPNYTNAFQKATSSESVYENNATASDQYIVAGLWTGTAAITSIQFSVAVGGNFLSGSTISLYKITKGTDGIVVVS
jgi:hypothetical protein